MNSIIIRNFNKAFNIKESKTHFFRLNINNFTIKEFGVKFKDRITKKVINIYFKNIIFDLVIYILREISIKNNKNNYF